MIDYYAKGSPPGFTGELIALHETAKGKFILIEENHEKRIFIYENTPKFRSEDIGKIYYITTDTTKKWDEIKVIVEYTKHANEHYGDGCLTEAQNKDLDKWEAKEKEDEMETLISGGLEDMDFGGNLS